MFSATFIEKCKPVYQEFKGWKEIKDAKKLSDLPVEAKKYLKFIEKHTGVTISLVSIGPGRKETIEV